MRSKLECFLGTLLLSIGIFLGVIRIVSFNQAFYRYEYRLNNVSEVVKMSDQDLYDTTLFLFDYIKGNEDQLIIEKPVDGVMKEVFTGREILHMKDVRSLYQNAMNVMYISLIAGAILFIHSILNKKGYKRSIMSFGYKFAMIVLSFFLIIILTYALADFDSFWVQFHYLLFDNLYFFLDPTQSILVNMVPDRFFFDLVMLILGSYILILALYGYLIHKPYLHALKTFESKEGNK